MVFDGMEQPFFAEELAYLRSRQLNNEQRLMK
jgi:hypothetical protein